jgi:hypothetical protein
MCCIRGVRHNHDDEQDDHKRDHESHRGNDEGPAVWRRKELDFGLAKLAYSTTAAGTLNVSPFAITCLKHPLLDIACGSTPCR